MPKPTFLWPDSWPLRGKAHFAIYARSGRSKDGGLVGESSAIASDGISFGSVGAPAQIGHSIGGIFIEDGHMLQVDEKEAPLGRIFKPRAEAYAKRQMRVAGAKFRAEGQFLRFHRVQ